MDKKQVKIAQFLDDTAMSDAVYDVLLNAFLSPYDTTTDVHLLAASRIALDMLPIAWKEMSKYKNQVDQDKREVTQVGL